MGEEQGVAGQVQTRSSKFRLVHLRQRFTLAEYSMQVLPGCTARQHVV